MVFKHRFVLGMASVDAAGVLFYPELFRHAHDAYEAFLTSLSEPLARLLDEGSFGIPIVHAEADYWRPMRHGETIDVHLRVATVRQTSFQIRQMFLGMDSTPRARVSTVHVWVNRDRGKPVMLPHPLRDKLFRYLEISEL